MSTQKPANVDDYIATFTPDVQASLQNVRSAIKATVPEAEETISYDIAAFTIKGRALVYYAGWQHHISMYPIPQGDDAYQKAIEPYKKSKGTLQFPLGQPIPHDVIAQTVKLLKKRL